jgi:hypothetical protein
VGPAHTLFSVIYTTIPSRRPSVKDIIGYVKKKILFIFAAGLASYAIISYMKETKGIYEMEKQKYN